MQLCLYKRWPTNLFFFQKLDLIKSGTLLRCAKKFSSMINFACCVEACTMHNVSNCMRGRLNGSQSGSRNRIYKWRYPWQLALNNTTARAYGPVIGDSGTGTKTVCSNHTQGSVKINRLNMPCVHGLFTSLHKLIFRRQQTTLYYRTQLGRHLCTASHTSSNALLSKVGADWLLFLGFFFRFGCT